ncbi:MAG: 3-deoxy-7-phosphoheptulonate synthase [Oscillospiraceae bacterium]|nr:MAG: 3-deoxy-7-phosphoheptulonate synthase [Oscillospiraceae bacterium]
MVVILNKNPDPKRVADLTAWLESLHLEIHPTVGKMQTILGLVGDTSKVDIELIRALDIVQDVKRISQPYKEANRAFHPDNTVIKVGDATFGDGSCPLIAGPCSVESREQLLEVAQRVKAAGATLLRGGAFKPRSSPYSFQGLHADGIKLLLEAKKETGLPIVTELMDLSQLDLFADVDVIQIGARNMQNFELLRQVGHVDKPVLLKRGLANTLQELLMSAEYILAGGNHRVILCERGIRTFETATRNTLDLSAIPMLHEMTHLPVIVDPSHASGIARLVKPMAMAAAACGADGLMIEVHNDPAHAKCDGPQSLTPDAFDDVAAAVRQIHPLAYRA